MYDKQVMDPAFGWYTSHKRVRAAKIITTGGPGAVLIRGGEIVKYNPEGKPRPAPGWYVLGYEDGYISFSPPEAFEKGYTPELLPPSPTVSGTADALWLAEPLYTDTMDDDTRNGAEVERPTPSARDAARDAALVRLAKMLDSPNEGTALTAAEAILRHTA